jgi:hypothetical protein
MRTLAILSLVLLAGYGKKGEVTPGNVLGAMFGGPAAMQPYETPEPPQTVTCFYSSIHGLVSCPR